MGNSVGDKSLKSTKLALKKCTHAVRQVLHLEFIGPLARRTCQWNISWPEGLAVMGTALMETQEPLGDLHFKACIRMQQLRAVSHGQELGQFSVNVTK